jgi:hypothetical protein
MGWEVWTRDIVVSPPPAVTTAPYFTTVGPTKGKQGSKLCYKVGNRDMIAVLNLLGSGFIFYLFVLVVIK